MNSLFTAEFFRANRQKLRSLVGDSPIVITANGLLQRNSDTTYPYRQDSSFWYLTGIDEPDVLLVMDGQEEFLIVPDQTDYQQIFDGTLNNAELKRVSGVEVVSNASKGWQRLGATLDKKKQVATLLPSEPYVETYGMYTNPGRLHLKERLIEVNPNIELVDIRPQLAGMRMIKQPNELKAIQAAIDLTAQAIEHVKKELPNLKYEYEIEALIMADFISAGAGEAWKPIVSAGKNATTLHYRANASPLKKDQLVLIDIGAEVSHYAADISRTFAISGKTTKRQQAVIEAVRDVQNYAYGLLKPGVLIKEAEKQIEVFMGEKLQQLGLIKQTEHEEIRKYFPHATSHFLGLDAHDVGDYTQRLEPNTVLTVEPGIYIPEEGIGVRIEDDILITKTGIEVLSRQLPPLL